MLFISKPLLAKFLLCSSR